MCVPLNGYDRKNYLRLGFDPSLFHWISSNKKAPSKLGALYRLLLTNFNY